LNHKFLATNYHDLALVHKELQNLSQSVEYFRLALKINTSNFGRNDLQVAMNHHGLGNCYLQLKDFKNAAEHLTQAFEIRKKFYGEAHPEVAKSLSSLAFLASLMENYEVSCQIH
jgi:tetratricopeptide (TPR) repeat protein